MLNQGLGDENCNVRRVGRDSGWMRDLSGRLWSVAFESRPEMGVAGMPASPHGGFGLRRSRKKAAGLGNRRLSWPVRIRARSSHQGAPAEATKIVRTRGALAVLKPSTAKGVAKRLKPTGRACKSDEISIDVTTPPSSRRSRFHQRPKESGGAIRSRRSQRARSSAATTASPNDRPIQMPTPSSPEWKASSTPSGRPMPQ